MESGVTQDKRETDPLLTSVLDGNWPSGCLFLEHILTYQSTLEYNVHTVNRNFPSYFARK